MKYYVKEKKIIIYGKGKVNKNIKNKRKIK